MPDNSNFLQQLAAGQNPRLQVQPGDEQAPANTVGNYFLNLVSAPSSWQTTVAQDKLGQSELAQNMGAGTMGTTGSLIQGNLAAMLEKQAAGKALSTAEQIAIKASQGNGGSGVFTVTGKQAPKGYAEGGKVENNSAWGKLKSAFTDDGKSKGHTPAPQLDKSKAKAFSSVFNSNYAEGGEVQNIPEALQPSPDIRVMSPEEQDQYSVMKPASGTFLPGGSFTPNPTIETQIPQQPENYQLPSTPMEAGPTPTTTPDMLGESYNNQVQGVQKQANAESVQAKAQMAAATEQSQKAQQLEQQYHANYEHLEQQRQAIMKDIENNHIDPNRYVNNLGTSGRIQSAIGIFLSGLGSGQGSNQALDFFNKQIERDVDSQKANLGKKQNMLTALEHQFGNLNDATAAMRVIYASKYGADVDKAAAASKDPMAKGRAQQLVGSLQAQYAPLMQQMALRQTIMQGGKTGHIQPEQAIAALVPKEHQTKAFEDMSKYQAAVQAGQDIKKIGAEVAKLQSFKNRLENPIQSKNLIDALNFQMLTVAKPLFGVLSDQERKAVENSLNINVTDSESTVKRKLQNLEDLAHKGAQPPNWLRAYGVPVPQPKTSNVTPINKPANYGR